MNWKKILLIAAIAGCFGFGAVRRADAGLSVGIGIGAPFGCGYGYGGYGYGYARPVYYSPYAYSATGIPTTDIPLTATTDPTSKSWCDRTTTGVTDTVTIAGRGTAASVKHSATGA